jgi:4-methyl-5(b-hydroxyethyl)-thiazole monophosphate biosynthesis
MKKRVLVPLASGFEEIEAITIVDVLRRGGIEVVLAGSTEGVLEGSRGIRVEPDTTLDDVDPAAFDAIVLPGGMKGALALMADERVLAAVRELHAAGRLTAAICAAPMVLAKAGIVDGKRITSHPSVRDRLGEAVVCADPRVLREGSVLTSQGPGTAMEFALALVRELAGPLEADEIARAMIVAS